MSLLSENKISKMVTLQEKEKTYFTFNVSQWNQTFFPSHFGLFILAIYLENYTQCKEQQAFSNYTKTEKQQK